MSEDYLKELSIAIRAATEAGVDVVVFSGGQFRRDSGNPRRVRIRSTHIYLEGVSVRYIVPIKLSYVTQNVETAALC